MGGACSTATPASPASPKPLARQATLQDMMKQREERKAKKGKAEPEVLKPIPKPPVVSTAEDVDMREGLSTPIMEAPSSTTSSCYSAEPVSASTSASTPAAPEVVGSSEELQEPPGDELADVMPSNVYEGNADDMDALFKVKDMLGRGLDSVVFAAETQPVAKMRYPQLDGQERVAMKMMKKVRLHEKGGRKFQRLRRELQIWHGLRHPSVLQLLRVFETTDTVLVICEIANEELFDRLEAIEKFNEADCKLVAAQVASAVAHLHISHSVAHRDIKSANILCAHERPTEAGCIKLTDFGFTERFTDPRAAEFTDNCGTLEYFAPELCENMIARLRNEPTIPYSAAVDCWALGCVLYECLAGQPPFWSDDDTSQVHLILRNRLDFPEESFEGVSEAAKNVLRGLLQPDPQTRLTIAEVLQAPWFEPDDPTASDQSQLSERLFPALQRPNAQATRTRRKSTDYRRKFSHAYNYSAQQPASGPPTDGGVDMLSLGLEGGADADLLALLAEDPNQDAAPTKARAKPPPEPSPMKRQVEALLSSTPNGALWRGTDDAEASIRRSNTSTSEWKGPMARRGSVQMKMEVNEALKALGP